MILRGVRLQEQGQLTLLSNDVKIHTLREDPHRRWGAGITIHHWMHSPRNPSKNPYHFLTNWCTLVQEVRIELSSAKASIYGPPGYRVMLDGNWLPPGKAKAFAYLDGLNPIDLKERLFKGTDEPWIGRLIHWTDVRY